MTTPTTDSDAGGMLSDDAELSRWGIRLRELTSEVAPTPLEPLNWKPKPTVWQRFRRGTAVPITAAAAVFIAVVLVSITVVWLQPHSLDLEPTDQEAVPFSSEAVASGNGAHRAAPLDSEIAATDIGSGASLAAPGMLYVHVVGEVNRPGVYELKPGSRALAAIEAAGGATDSAVLNGLNLARLVIDGEQLVVPDTQHLEASQAGDLRAPYFGPDTAVGGLVSLNSADQSALETLPRVGPSLAKRILDWRTMNGGFQSVDQLLNVSGIGQKTFEQLSDLVTL